jgi:hypothetical protein
LLNRVVDHHGRLVLHDYHVHHNPYRRIHLQFVVDLDNPFENVVAYKNHTVAVVDNHHHHRHHVPTIRLLDDLQ